MNEELYNEYSIKNTWELKERLDICGYYKTFMFNEINRHKKSIREYNEEIKIINKILKERNE